MLQPAELTARLRHGLAKRHFLQHASLADYSCGCANALWLMHSFFGDKQRCQDQIAVRARRTAPQKTAKPLSNAHGMRQRLSHRRKKASGLFPSKNQTDRTDRMAQTNRTRPTAVRPTRHHGEAASPISDRLLVNRLPCRFFGKHAGPKQPPQTPVPRQPAPSIHREARAPRRPGCR